jgi:hypothetical protein
MGLRSIVLAAAMAPALFPPTLVEARGGRGSVAENIWSARQRAGAHYRERAVKLREFAETEHVEEVRQQLLVVAEQYEELAKGLLQSN